MTANASTLGRDQFRSVDDVIAAASRAMCAEQNHDGHWVYQLEADATIPAEYVLMRFYLGEPVERAFATKVTAYLTRIQSDAGGWPLFHGGAFDMSASVKAYFALKMIGEDVASPTMSRARAAIIAHGGAAKSNVFTRILLSLFGVIGWNAVPAMPVEIMLLPRWFPFHISKISYWARTVLVPLLVLRALKPSAKCAGAVSIDELFLGAPRETTLAAKAAHQNAGWFYLFRSLDAVLRFVEPGSPQRLRKKAISQAEKFVLERLNGEEGLGAIFPAMVNAVLMFDALGYPRQDHAYVSARLAIDKLIVETDPEVYCQPCVSPVWDTALASHAMLEAGEEAQVAAAHHGLEWLGDRQILEFPGDWSRSRPSVRPGGWAFQYANPHYPDLDDTAVVVMAMDRADKAASSDNWRHAIERGRDWVVGLQSKNGGWGAFDVDNTHHALNNIPFSDHGALLDPPTEDVTARCVSMICQLGARSAREHEALQKGLAFLLNRQTPDGSWFGRWGINYIYGTWSVLCALHAAGFGADHPAILKASDWLISIQNADGGWGEDGASYKLDYRGHEPAPSTPSQTAWAVLGLMAAGRVEHTSVGKGIAYLRRTQTAAGSWAEVRFTATGFPRVFYLRYHGYAQYFPLWALARYRNLRRGETALSGM